jgi:hypothetical protein
VDLDPENQQLLVETHPKPGVVRLDMHQTFSIKTIPKSFTDIFVAKSYG